MGPRWRIQGNTTWNAYPPKVAELNGCTGSSMKGSRQRNTGLAIGIVLLLFLSGCGAAYSGYMSHSLKQLEKSDYEGALAKLEKPDSNTNKLLYYLEKGLILHYQGQYEASNLEFERAEKLSDVLYTRSVSREVAALLSNDSVVAYRGEEFEMTLVHYYRAMNYQRLGERQAALVECRKANLRLENYAQQAEYDLSYKNDAFLQYMTGLFFEAEGELNDAYISYKDALQGYRAYDDAFGLPIPRMLLVDLTRLADRLGYDAEAARYGRRFRLRPDELQRATGSEVVVFVESGFVPRKHQVELTVPIMDDERKVALWTVSERAVHRYHHPRMYHRRRVDYWLKVALPEYREVHSQVVGVRLRAGGESAMAIQVEDLQAIAQRTFAQKFDTIMLRTVARNLAKYMASKSIEKAFESDEDDKDTDDWAKDGLGEVLGGLFNLFGRATEAADTRGWLSLPSSIRIARLPVVEGLVAPTLELIDDRGQVVAVEQLPEVAVESGETVFLNFRTFR